MFETKQLRIFKTIVEVGSFTRAGEALGLSQPSISQHVRALEEAAGVPLLVRVGKGTRPTPAGDVGKKKPGRTEGSCRVNRPEA